MLWPLKNNGKNTKEIPIIKLWENLHEAIYGLWFDLSAVDPTVEVRLKIEFLKFIQ